MGLVDYAKEELERAGLFDADADYNGDAAVAVLDLVKRFAGQGHSGASAGLVLAIFEKLARFQPLTPITSDPSEWMEVGPNTWQCRRNPSLFSNDGGKTWHDIDEFQGQAE